MKMAAKRIPVIGTNIAGSQAAAYSPVMGFLLVLPPSTRRAKPNAQMIDPDQSGLAVIRRSPLQSNLRLLLAHLTWNSKRLLGAMVLDRLDAGSVPIQRNPDLLSRDVTHP